ncbi:MAG: tight adherence protein, partial [Actinomycetota bacterium]|nr:tight adherence protein [Actinomycetota bacterium]
MSNARLAVGCGLALWAGMTLVLSEVRWFARPTLVERLRPYAPGGLGPRRRRDGVLSVESFREVIRPLSRTLGERVAAVFGVTEDLATRLQRIHSPLDVTAFRVRQLGWAGAGFAFGSMLAATARPPAIVALLFILGGPLLAFLIVEQQVAAASDRWKRRLVVELPVIAEQLAMLLSAGYSLGAALNRIAARGRGAAATDL